METNSTYYIDLISRYFCGDATPEDILELETWVKADPANAAVFSAYHKTWNRIEGDGMHPEMNLDQEWKSLATRLNLSKESIRESKPDLRIIGSSNTTPESEIANGFAGLRFAPVHKSKIYNFSLRVAAIFLLFAIPTFLLFQYLGKSEVKQLSAGNEIMEYTLPDGSTVTLNAGAILTFPSDFDGPLRRVTLQGEAWFEVARDKTKPFIIAAGNARIRVVGTSFFVNTNTARNTREIILASGMVRVYYENSPGTAALLLPGEKVEMTAVPQEIIKSRNSDANYLAWKTRYIVFEDTPLLDVIALLNKVYMTNIMLTDKRLRDCRITATFDKQSLESVLNVLKATLDLQVRNTGTEIHLSGNGCFKGM
jgi:ferric-dicitrate binding protein FerR (iron transport regulator)